MIRNKWLKTFKDAHATVRLVTANGYQVFGYVEDFDDSGVTIKNSGGVEFFFYHNISSMREEKDEVQRARR